jgi:hypothetical protein
MGVVSLSRDDIAQRHLAQKNLRDIGVAFPLMKG